jgi:hypothetical protein
VRWKLYRSAVEIDLLYVQDCPNRSLARARVEHALAQTGVAARVREREVRTSEEAAQLGMRGSPTILIDGADPFADDATPATFSCRLYRDEAVVSGAPTVEQLISVLGR